MSVWVGFDYARDDYYLGDSFGYAEKLIEIDEETEERWRNTLAAYYDLQVEMAKLFTKS